MADPMNLRDTNDGVTHTPIDHKAPPQSYCGMIFRTHYRQTNDTATCLRCVVKKFLKPRR